MLAKLNDSMEVEINNGLEVVAKCITATIKQPYTVEEIVNKLTLDDYDAGLMLRSLLIHLVAARAENVKLREVIDSADKVHDIIEIVGNLCRDMRDGESAAGWAKRVIREREKLRARLALGSAAPLAGKWRHGGGVLCCGTLRVASEDFDTDPAPDFRREVMDWICAALNAAGKG